MKYSLLIILMLLTIAFLLSCSIQDERTAAGITIDEGILFYSDENNIKEEDSYYEALIELKHAYPAQFDHYQIIAKNQEYDSTLTSLNDTYPALLIIKDNKVVCKVIGEAKKEDILTPVRNQLDQWN
ncbi:hypothetical protein V1502_06490 [Bacillus sp. SCS-153A]|uniref:hypothetical protein n=1 Tax=Rossellomorea sedimentorum TaxID=3115294 RepID=UPI0039058EF6